MTKPKKAFSLFTPEDDIVIESINQNYTITFSKDEKIVGKMDWNTGKMIFTGNADESAKLFFNNFLKPYIDAYIDAYIDYHIKEKKGEIKK